MRVGLGYDAHRLVAGRPLILGGVEIPHALGLSGHSDADVLAHAIGDDTRYPRALANYRKRGKRARNGSPPPQCDQLTHSRRKRQMP